MKIICKYSAVIYTIQDEENPEVEKHFPDIEFADIHPIFRVPTRTLLSKAKKWSEGRYTDLEEKLLFLALLNSTESVRFHSYADPNPATVAGNMERMFKLAAWYDHAKNQDLELPKFSITEQNYTLSEIRHWINRWFEVRDEWGKPASRKLLQDSLLKREQVISKLLNSPYLTQSNKTRLVTQLAHWAVKTASVPQHVQPRWLEVLKMTEEDVFLGKTSFAELSSIQGWMEERLYLPNSPGAGYGTAYSQRVLSHIRNLAITAEKGPLAALKDGAIYSFLDEDGNTQQVESTETTNTKLLISRAPKDEPLQINYVGRMIEYYKDRAAWRLAQSVLEQLDEEAKEKELGYSPASGQVSLKNERY